jgi:uncharacterized protein (TIGR02594 family)
MTATTLVTPSDFAAFPWMKFALQEMGTLEYFGATRNNPRILAYHKTCGVKTKSSVVSGQSDAVAWCSAFANWCMNQAGLVGTQAPHARSWLQWGEFLPITAPVYGCIVVFSRGHASWQGHVGFFVGPAPGGRICVLGGNQRSRNGDAVCLKEFATQDWLGYRWPLGLRKP